MRQIKDFKIGEIYLMNPTNKSHSNKPYFVKIKNITNEYIETSIPFYHSLKIPIKDKYMWRYHTNRMFKIGSMNTNSKKLYFQKNLTPSSLSEKIVNIIYKI